MLCQLLPGGKRFYLCPFSSFSFLYREVSLCKRVGGNLFTHLTSAAKVQARHVLKGEKGGDPHYNVLFYIIDYL